MGRVTETSARSRARIVGAFHLLLVLSGGLAVFARRGLREKENVHQTNALAPQIACCQHVPH